MLNFCQNFIMKKIIFAFTLLLWVGAQAQVTVLEEHFDSTPNGALPNGWSADSGTFAVDSSNFSTGYTGSSGLKNVVIRNTAPSGVFYLTTPAFSTVDLFDAKLIWGARHSTNFPTPGSRVDTLHYRVGSGPWQLLPFAQNAANSLWALVNGGLTIPLPSAAINQPAVQIRWQANIVNNAQGSYRIDDVLVQGTGIAGISSLSPTSLVRMGNIWRWNPGELSGTLMVFNAVGAMVLSADGQNGELNTQGLTPGLYYLRTQRTTKPFIQLPE
jgi:hypothetical protein